MLAIGKSKYVQEINNMVEIEYFRALTELLNELKNACLKITTIYMMYNQSIARISTRK